jgi:tetratricopeptide (TPR) repeat protein
MRSWVLLAGLALLLPALAWASDSPHPILEARGARAGLVLRLSLPEGFHVGADAPLKLGLDSAMPEPLSRRERRRLLGRFGLRVAPASSALLVVGVCDDAGSCVIRNLRAPLEATGRFRVVEVEVVDPRTLAGPSAGAEQTAAAAPGPSDDARPALYRFSAEWCPPCMALKAEVFENPAHADLLEGVRLVAVDVDHLDSWELKERYEVGPYPTLVLATPAGELIARLVGYPGASEVRAWLEGALAVPEALATRSDAPGTLAAAEEARLAMARAGEDCDDRTMELLASAVARLPSDARRLRSGVLAARGDCLEERGQLLEAASSLGASVDACPACPDGAWRAYHAARLLEEALESEARAVDEEQVRLAWERAAEVARTRLRVGVESPSEGVRWFLGKALEELDDPAGAVVVYTEALALLDELLPRDPDGALSLGGHALFPVLLDYLAAAGLDARLEFELTTMAELLPQEFTYHHRLAGFYLEAERLEEAERAARRALAEGHGDQKLRAAARLVDCLRAQQRVEEARAVVMEVLAAVPEPPDPVIRTHRYRKALQARIDEMEEGSE